MIFRYVTALSTCYSMIRPFRVAELFSNIVTHFMQAGFYPDIGHINPDSALRFVNIFQVKMSNHTL